MATQSQLPRTGQSTVSDGATQERDPRAALVVREVVHADIPDDAQKKIMEIALVAFEKYVLWPTRSTWRKEEGSRKELEAEVERTNLRDIACSIKKEVDLQLGSTWHVIYGRSYATFVTHERMCFFHFTMDGADVVVWKHGG